MSKLKQYRLIKADPEPMVREAAPCPLCGKVALVMLTPRELAESLKQGDTETFAVCHPALGGCNTGFGV